MVIFLPFFLVCWYQNVFVCKSFSQCLMYKEPLEKELTFRKWADLLSSRGNNCAMAFSKDENNLCPISGVWEPFLYRSSRNISHTRPSLTNVYLSFSLPGTLSWNETSHHEVREQSVPEPWPLRGSANIGSKEGTFKFHVSKTKSRCLLQCSVTVKRQLNHGNSYKRKHWIGAGLQFRV